MFLFTDDNSVGQISPSYENDPDVRLMLAVQQGDKKAFETLMTKFYPRILNFVYKFVRNRARSEELTQEIFIRVYKSVARYAPKAKFQTWLYTIARNVCLNEVTRNKRKFVSLDAPSTFDGRTLEEKLENERSPDPGHQVLHEERKRQVKKAIFALPPNQRTALILRRYENMSYQQIAETMKTSSKAVKSLLNRAKENLKISLKAYIQNDI
ncbi:MAG: sigma-70 family RNA polymerase sigma factor [Candidatus Omnitrophica bacterium]|nr:sigma-70 family RNA polymerase sigma factor [Candidatus Omnitrophota bacterium]